MDIKFGCFMLIVITFFISLGLALGIAIRWPDTSEIAEYQRRAMRCEKASEQYGCTQWSARHFDDKCFCVGPEGQSIYFDISDQK